MFGPTRGAATRTIGPGFFLWPELRVRERGQATRFYAAVLGGTLAELPEDDMTVLGGGDGGFASIAPMSDAERASGIADHWRLYLVRGSVGRTVAAQARGSSAAGASSDGLVRGVPGARLAAAQARAHFGDRFTAGREAVLWTELGTDQGAGFVDAARSIEPSTLLRAAMNEPLDAEPADLARAAGAGPLLFCNEPDGRGGAAARAGILVGVVDAEGAQVSNVCLSVDDCAGALKRARRAGGTIVGSPTDAATGGRLGAVIDPHGAPFFCWQAPVTAALRTSQGGVRASAAPSSGSWAAASDAARPRVKIP